MAASNDKTYSCEVCHKQFSKKHHLKQHMDTHNDGRKKHSCDLCDKKYTSKRSLYTHVRATHEGIKPHKCPDCDYKTDVKTSLQKHILTHTKERPFMCQECHKTHLGQCSHDSRGEGLARTGHDTQAALKGVFCMGKMNQHDWKTQVTAYTGLSASGLSK